ncbi:MAG: hypothetical protein IKX19_06130, partial [Clostridia bacterium]|nr:hypothetical protein [Clostridia bacterium]
RDLYARARVFFPAVWGTETNYIEDFAPRKDGEPFLKGYLCPSVTAYDPERGVESTYFVCRGRYENWADLDAAGRSLFTGALWESVTGPGQRCMNYGTRTAFLWADAGGNGYDPALDRFELVEKTEDRITYWFITSYRARGTFEVESSERTLITMEKTAEGWRFASFRVGSWLPAGTTAEKTTVHVNTPEEAESLVRMLVRGVMDESWLEGRNSFTPTDAQYFTQGLKTAFSDAAFPFREAVLSPDGTAWTIHADHIRDAVKELFGIPDFDYIDAVRELYGDGADNSVSVDGLGFLSFPADIGDHTTKFDVSELFSYEEDGTVTVFAHLVNASDYPWDEADYGIYCFKFQTDFDGPGLTVENTAVQWTRGEVEAEIARLMGQRTIAVNDMNNASARNVEIETEIHRLRSVLEDESSPGDDRRAAVQRLEDLEPLREQQYALEERCLEAVKQFAARIRMYEMILAKMDGGSYADDLLSARLRSLTAEDILCLGSSFDHITAEELAPILNRTGILGGQPAPEDFRAYYTLDVYLSELPSGGFGSESETLTLFAGLERDLVRILWSGEGTHKADERFVRDEDLYRILRENYRLTEQIDADAFEKWGEAARERAAETVENTLGMDGSLAFTDYRIIYFVITDAFERDDAWYTVCSWRPVFLTDDPENVVWAGGMLLDADGRVYGAEVETYLVEKWTSSGTRTAFLLWDLYAGPDRETGIAWGRDRIVKAFEQLENEEDGIKQDRLVSYALSPVFEESVTEGLYKREITILGFEGDSAHKDEINEFLRQGEAVRQTYLNGVRDTEYPSPEWYDDWVLRISAGSAEAGDLLFLTVRTIHPSTYIDVPQYDTRILDRREDRLISLDEAVSALGFDVGARTAAAEKAFVGSIGGLREDQKFKYFEFRDFIALEGRLYERYEYDFYGVDFAQGWLEPVDAVPALTAEEADTLAADLSRYLRITEIDSASVPHDATIADETGLYFKVTDQQFASWDGWQSFVRNIFTEEAAQRILADPDGVMKEVSGFSFIQPGAGGGFDPNRYTCFARSEEGGYKLIIVYSVPPSEEDESGSLTLAFPLRYENGAWRVERMESEPAHAATFNPAERTASSLDELPNLGLDESDARLRYIRAFVAGDVDTLELVCGVEKGMYADYSTLELSSWAVWIDPAEDRSPLRFSFVPTHSDVEAFPTDVRTEGTVYEGLIGAYLSRSGSSPSFGEAADELYDLLSNHILLDLPTTDEMDYPTRFALSCYICDKLGNTDLTEENIRDYAEKHFGIEDFTPDGAHVGSHGGHGGSHQFLDIVGSEEKDGETVVTVQYYADWSKTVNSGTWQYTMRKTDDGWSFTGSEEIRHSDYERARQVM